MKKTPEMQAKFEELFELWAEKYGKEEESLYAFFMEFQSLNFVYNASEKAWHVHSPNERP